eukprot:TRINITY_DN801_c0_g1_i3.p1 TRINITY_DN801_c0_g1~~TRINITY_DN801_c0_g1_i3.p1  ORF type:complete len:327 (-),score=198.61 TRINITY_DN801_c0_g1_i3:132-1112(-)
MSYWYQAYNQNQVAPEVSAWFQQINANKNGQISPEELSKGLTALYQQCYGANCGSVSVSTARSLIQLFDNDRNGVVSLNEFSGMYTFILTLRQAFITYDVERKNSLTYPQILQALVAQGFTITYETVSVLLRRFDHQKNQTLNWDEFIECSAFLASLRTVFQWHQMQKAQISQVPNAVNAGKDAKKQAKKQGKVSKAGPNSNTVTLNFDQFVRLDGVFHAVPPTPLVGVPGQMPGQMPMTGVPGHQMPMTGVQGYQMPMTGVPGQMPMTGVPGHQMPMTGVPGQMPMTGVPGHQMPMTGVQGYQMPMTGVPGQTQMTGAQGYPMPK